jgi:hypothetical protein
MPPGNPVRLFKLAGREFHQLTGKPAAPESSRKFKPMRLDPEKFSGTWDRKRGSAARLMAVLLREDDAALERRVCEPDKTVRVYADAAEWLQRESAYLRKVARLLETAGTHVSAVLGRCGREDAASA